MLMVSTRSILPILEWVQSRVDEQYCLAYSNKLVPSKGSLSLSLVDKILFGKGYRKLIRYSRTHICHLRCLSSPFNIDSIISYYNIVYTETWWTRIKLAIWCSGKQYVQCNTVKLKNCFNGVKSVLFPGIFRMILNL